MSGGTVSCYHPGMNGATRIHLGRALAAWVPSICKPAAERLRDYAFRRQPEWSYLQHGWNSIPTSAWDTQSVAAASVHGISIVRDHVETSLPFGARRADTGAVECDRTYQDMVLVFGCCLALAAQGKAAVSVLDWDGGSGAFPLLGRGLLPDCKLDYIIHGLPELAATGEPLGIDAQFVDATESFRRSHDFIVTSSSLQYEQDLKSRLGDLAKAANRYLLVTRLPTTVTAPSLVVGQHAYGTAYQGWVLNFDEFIGLASSRELTLVRQFTISEPMHIPAAPSQVQQWAFLSKPRNGPVPSS